MERVQLIDIGMGNIQSVRNVFSHFNVSSNVIHDGRLLQENIPIILPGVGSFRIAMERLNEHGFIPPLKQSFQRGEKILGICLGMQLLFDYGCEDGGSDGLGFISGTIDNFSRASKIPHMGYNRLLNPQKFTLTAELTEPYFYFVHSYCVHECEADEIAYTDYDENFVSAVRNKNCYGTQFHPEKSQSAGLHLIKKFCEAPAS